MLQQYWMLQKFWDKSRFYECIKKIKTWFGKVTRMLTIHDPTFAKQENGYHCNNFETKIVNTR